MIVSLFVALWFILRGDFKSLFYFEFFFFFFFFFSVLFSIAVTSLGKERANLALVRFCLFPHTLDVSQELRLMIVTLDFSFTFFFSTVKHQYLKSSVQPLDIESSH